MAGAAGPAAGVVVAAPALFAATSLRALPENWRTISRSDRRVFQRADRDYYIVLGEGTDEWLVVLYSQGDRAYPAPLVHQTVSGDADLEQVIQEIAQESNDLIEPTEREC